MAIGNSTDDDDVRYESGASTCDPIVSLATKVESLDRKIAASGRRLEQARLEIAELMAENRELRRQLARQGKVGGSLVSKQEQILELLHQGDALPVSKIAESVDLSVFETKCHLDELGAGGFVVHDINRSVSVVKAAGSSALVRARGGYYASAHYRILGKGREYVAANLI